MDSHRKAIQLTCKITRGGELYVKRKHGSNDAVKWMSMEITSLFTCENEITRIIILVPERSAAD